MIKLRQKKNMKKGIKKRENKDESKKTEMCVHIIFTEGRKL